jgi:hypothetical protein
LLYLVALVASLPIAVPQQARTIPMANSSLITAAQQQTTAIDRCLSRPTRIVLTIEQQGRVDSVRLKYETERKAVNEVARTQGDLAATLKMRDLDAKYQKLVRALLTPEQQAVFDKNVQAGFAGPRP